MSLVLLQTSSINTLQAFILGLIPLFVIIAILRMMGKLGGGKKGFSFALIIMAGLLASLFVLAVPVSAATASPGSTSTVQGMPVSQTITGFTASKAYQVICTTGTNYTVHDSVVADSAGSLTFTVNYFAQFGQNSYTVEGAVVPRGTAVVFNIDNIDILELIIPLIMIIVVFSIVGMITKAFK